VIAAVTGATGFVGGRLIARLGGRGVTVRALARPTAAAHALEGCEIVRGALADRSALDALCAGADVVYHVAAAIAAPSESAFLATNEAGTRIVAEAARAAGVRRLLYVSSLSATGPSPDGTPLDEDAGPGPVSAYGRSKRAGEDVVRASGVPFTIVRPPVVYGPGDRQTLRLFRLARTGVLPVPGPGRQRLSLVDVDDLVDALVTVAAADATAGGTYHASHERALGQEEMAAALGAAMGRKRVRLLRVPAPLVHAVLAVTGTAARVTGRATLLDTQKLPELLAPHWVCSSARLTNDTGWRARTAPEEGFARAAAWYREHGWL
jgi:dihydroflavonol-4-reductase